MQARSCGYFSHRLGVRIAASPRRANEIATNKINASILLSDFAAASSFRRQRDRRYPVRSLSVQLGIYVTVSITLDSVNGLLSDPLPDGDYGVTALQPSPQTGRTSRPVSSWSELATGVERHRGWLDVVPQ
jgi:hypothetical protein